MNNILNLYLHVFWLLVIYCCNKSIQPDCTNIKGFSVFSWKPLSPEVSTSSPYTHAQQRMRTSITSYTFAWDLPLHRDVHCATWWRGILLLIYIFTCSGWGIWTFWHWIQWGKGLYGSRWTKRNNNRWNNYIMQCYCLWHRR